MVLSQLARSAGLAGFVELSRELGLKPEAMAAAVGLPAQALTDPDLMVSSELMGRMYELAAEQSGADDFGLRVAERRRMSNLGALGLVMREQPNLRKALQAYVRYQGLESDAYALSLEEFGDQAVLKIQGPVRQQRQGPELMVGVAIRTLRALLGETWKPLEVRFTHAAPARTDAHRRVLGATPLFDQDDLAIVIARADLETPIPSADPGMAREVARYLDRMIEGRGVELKDKVSGLIATLLPHGACSVEMVAQRLGMDRRTLHRKLSAEGTTFSDLLDSTRREMAVSLLVTSSRPLQGVADLLGFSSLSAFAHWFRRHFDQSASAYRANHAEPRPARAFAAAE